MSDQARTRELLRAMRSGSLSREDGLDLLRGGARPSADSARTRRPDPAGAVGALLVSLIARHTSTPPERIARDAPLDRYGFDSVMALGVVRDLRPAFGDLPATLLFERRTVADLAGHLVAEYPDAARRLAAGTAGTAETAETTDTTAFTEPIAATAARERTPEPGRNRDVAIVGLSGRFPGAADLDAFWDNLRQGRDCVEEVPPGRWDADAVAGAGPDTAHLRWGGFLTDVDRFDHSFFNLSPRQARYMDPQERLLLQEVWHACEDAGIPRRALAGRSAGVYVGVMYSQYELWGASASPYRSDYLGASYASIANRVSHFFDLRGPSIALDTMCSSSLTALHLACEALRAGSIDAAVVAGVNLTVHPKKHQDLGRGGFAATGGRCRSFGSGGDGYVPGEAVAVAVLKRAADAERDGNRVWATVRGTAISHGGRTNGYTTPNPEDQTRVLRRALADAATEPGAVSYVEAHGTGTALGDPLEIRSLAGALGDQAGRPRPCAVGSVKSNVGHCEAAAGLVGLAKTVLQLRHGELVPSLHAEPQNPDLALPEGLLRIQTRGEPWPAEPDGVRVAGLSSFGAGGSNAHVVLAEAPAEPTRAAPAPGDYVLPLSARSRSALRAAVSALRAHLTEHRPRLDDVQFTLVHGREHLEERSAVVAGSVDEAIERLTRLESDVDGTALADGDGGGPQHAWARSWCAGEDPEPPVSGESAGRLIRLPGYVFDRPRHWPESAPAEPVNGGASGGAFSDAGGVRTLRLTRDTAVLADHVVRDACVVPAAALLDLVRRSVAPGQVVRNCAWPAPLVVPDGGVDVELTLEPGADGTTGFVLRDAADGRVRCEGTLARREPGTPATADLSVPDHAERLDGAWCYRRFAGLGLAYGPSLRVLETVWVAGDDCLARLTPPAADVDVRTVLVDAALQALIGFGHGQDRLLLPFAVNGVDLGADVASARWVRVTRRADHRGPGATYDIVLAGADGTVVGRLDAVTVLPVDGPDRAPGSGAEPRPVPGSAPELCHLTARWVPDNAAAAAAGPQRILLLVPDAELADRLTRALTATGWAGSVVTALGDASVAADAAGSGARVDTVLNLLGCAGSPTRLLTPEETAAQVGSGFEAIVRPAAALLRAPGTQPVRCLDVRPADDPYASCSAAVHRTLAVEDDRYRGRTVLTGADLGAPGSARWCAAVAAEVLRGVDQGTTVRLDGAGRAVRRLDVSAAPEPVADVPLRHGGVYLITGALGGLGRELARHLAARWSARLVLAGRGPADDRAQALLAEIRAAGGDGVYVAADCAQRDGARSAVDAALTGFGALHGVFHLAAVLHDALAVHQAPGSAAAVLAPKVWGAVWLDRATADLPLDCWVAFGSASAYVGVPGQTAYGYANAHLAALARERERAVRAGERSGRTLVVSWPLWESGGMGVDVPTRDLLAVHLGWQPLPVAAGMTALEAALAGDGAVHAPVYGDPAVIRRWADRHWATGHAARPAGSGPATPTGDRIPNAADRVPDAGGPVPDRFVRHLVGIVAEELGMAPHELTPGASFDRLGLESVMVMNLNRTLGADLGPLPSTLFFRYRSVGELAAGLWASHREAVARLVGPDDRPEPAASPPDSTVAAAPAEPPAPAATGVRAAGRPDPAADDPIAIVGLAGRYPQSDDLAEYWATLAGGRDCVTEVPADRWDHERLFDPEVGRPGRTYSKWGGFLRDIASFDARFFHIAPSEARQLDPQERLFLQTAWRAVEDAGYSRTALSARRVGVYAGVMHAHYQMYGADAGLRAQGFLPSSLGAAVANRVSYCLDLRGPSMTVDTMCSSSLTAIHLACAAIRAGECEVALAGGVNVISHPYRYLQMAQGRFASTDGRCRSFGDGGDGYVPGEGVGVVVLKRLSQAERDGDHVHGVIRGSAINHGGRTNGFTVPSVTAQAEVIAAALRTAGAAPADIDYVEAHGTGTALGDPIEVAALDEVFAGSGASCPIGSVKSNVGHLESAAGIAALTKVLLQLRHGELVPSLHSEPANPRIDFAGVHVQRSREPWRSRSGHPGRLTAAISSFGAGGANAHLIVESGPGSLREEPVPEDGRRCVVRLSARSERALRATAARLADHLSPSSAAGTDGASRAGELAAAVADVLGLAVSDVDVDADPAELGLDTFSAADIAARLVPTDQAGALAHLLGTERSLAAVAGHLPARREPDRAPVRLADVAHTLAVGREEFAERVAFVVSGVGELVGALRQFATTGGFPGAHRGSCLPGADHADRAPGLFRGATGDAFLAAVAREGRDAELAELWVRGVEVPWHDPAGAPARRIPLPGAVFEEERLWLPEPVAVDATPDRTAETPDRTAETLDRTAETPAPAPVPAPAAVPAPAPVPTGPAPVASPQRSVVEVLGTVRAVMAAVLEIPADALDLDVPHAEFGVDSVLAVEIVERINAELVVALRPTDFFNYTTIRSLAEHVTELLPDEPSPQTPAPDVTPPVTPPSAATAPTVPAAPAVPAVPAGPDAPAGDEVAVIGLSARFPGADDVEALWRNLCAGTDSVGLIPPERWDVDDHFDPDRFAPRKTYSKWGAVLGDADRFDADFFGLSPREAQLMDPQHRLFLETAWHAMEDAGYPAERLRGRNVSVHVGASAGDYQNYLRDNGVAPEGYTFTGTHAAVLASRLAYHLDLRGPSVTVDTSCSSSLLAIHLACEAIRSGQTELAFAGGVALLFTPELHVLASKAGMLSPTGRCRAFDQGADGFVPGEGVAVVVLKSLRRARADGDRILGVVRASGANQDGRSNGLTAPNMVAQRDLEVDVYRRFGIDPREIGYVECHGTGTRLGDPIEVEALTAAFRSFTADTGFCGLGSIKSNIGHALTAAGIAGFVKALLCLRHRELVPTLHVDQVNDHLELAGSPFYVSTAARPFPAPPGGVRMAAISSFGFSGTNVHLVLAEPPAGEPPARRAPSGPVLVPVSAKTDAALARRVSALAARLADGGDLDLGDIAHTLAAHRSHFARRAVFAADSTAGLARRLADAAAGRPVADDDLPAGPAGVRDRYLAGGEVDWRAVVPDGRIVDLPLYPFEDARHWPAQARAPRSAAAGVPESGTADPAAGLTVAGDGHPAATILLEPSNPLVQDHIVGGLPILPAAGHLSLLVELVRSAFGRTDCTVTRAVWLRPVVVEVPVLLRLGLTPDGGAWKFEVTGELPDGSTVSHSRGTVELGAEPAAPVDLAAARAEATATGDAALHYHRFTTLGVHYGPAFQTITGYGVGRDTVVADLERVPGERNGVAAGVLDGAIQSVLELPGDDDESGPQLPFGIDRVRVFGAVPQCSVSVVRQHTSGECDITVATPAGAPLILVEGMSYRPLRESAELHDLEPVWREIGGDLPTPPVNATGDVLLLGGDTRPELADALAGHARGRRVHRCSLGDPALADRVRELDAAVELGTVYLLADADTATGPGPARERHGLPALRALRALAGGRHAGRALEVVFLTVDGHQVRDGDPIAPANALMFGLQRSLARERRSWSVRCVDLAGREIGSGSGGAAAVVARALALPVHPAGREVALRDGRAWALDLRPSDASGVAAPVTVRRGGTYLILGGAGGIGFSTAVHLARTAAANVVLLGRRPADAGIRQRLDLVERAGGRALYLPVDAADPAALRTAVATAVERFGPVHGAFHSALVLRDEPVQSMSDEAWQQVCLPKLDGAVNLVDALVGQPLELLVFYSSAQSFLGNAGQANYAAASTFLDAYARQLRSRAVPAAIVNWGYWGDVGIVAAPEYRRRMTENGVGSITPAEGMLALDRCLRDGRFQTLVVKAEPRALAVFGGATPDTRDEPAAPPAPGFDPLAGAATVVVPGIGELLTAHDGLVRRGLALALRQLAGLGVADADGWVRPAKDWTLSGTIVPAFHRQVAAVLAHARETGVLERSGDRWLLGAAARESDADGLAAGVEQWGRDHPVVAAQARLLAACLRAYPDLLRGAKDPTEVMFPGSSMDLVEAVYRDDPLAAGLNELVRNAVAAKLAQGAGTVRVLEIGAGTGATAQAIAPLLAEHPDRTEYVYTDLSAGFLRHGRRTVGFLPNVDFRRLDAERPAADQGFATGSFDVVVAANVLHATRDLRESLRNAAGLLAPGGWLVLLETTSVSGFATLTFGLLDGWWRFTDDVREPGSPLASTGTWTTLLRENGFDATAVCAPDGVRPGDIGQHVVIGRRAGGAEAASGRGDIRAAAAPPDVPEPVSVPRTEPAPGSRDRAATAASVDAVVARTLGRQPGSLDPDQPFTEYGVDSIILVELVTALNEQLGTELKPTALFDHPTVNALADHLVTEGTPATGSTAAPDPADPDRSPHVLAQPARGDVRAAAAPSDVPEPVSAPGSRDRAAAAASVDAVVARTLGRQPGSLDPDQPFTEYGVDSIILVELVTALNEQLGTELKPTALFDHPTVNALADHLVTEGAPATGSTADPDPADPDRSTDVLAQLARGDVSIEDALRELESIGE
ncbi:SDR family NAD(P)-dependent oxidoreductase [Streptomyces sp. NPDC092296]|uniref:SDR family NAD(P)-dependent oxidoreductase n=1 Tax=Streptomyces sp. NPDC092296 TaxID=3366012 RepID=UPI0037F2CD01